MSYRNTDRVQKSSQHVLTSGLSYFAKFAFCAITATVTFTSTTSAQAVTSSTEIAAFDGSAARINISGELRMLTEQIGAAACRLTAGYDEAGALDEIARIVTKFDGSLVALRDGNSLFAIPNAEKNSRILTGLNDLERVWAQFQHALSAVTAGRASTEQIEEFAALIRTQEEVTEILAAEYIGQYTNPAELLSANAFTINLANRQQKTLQQLSREVCGTVSGQNYFGSIAEVQETTDLFETSLKALENGASRVGIIAPPNDLIVDMLEQSRNLWDEIEAPSDALQFDAETKAEAEAIIQRQAELTGGLMQNMDNLVTLYMVASPGQERLYYGPMLEYAETELVKWTKYEPLIDLMRESSENNADLSEEEMIELDQAYRDERASDGDKPWVDSLTYNDVSDWLRVQINASGGAVQEAFAYDAPGLNVAQGHSVTDLWQGDGEAKWVNTIGSNQDIFIDSVEWDTTTQTYQVQVTMAVRDLDTKEIVGAISFGIGVQYFL